ncbi:MAG: hypothetical protein IKP98_00210 [Bacilli bacterium]|nr:hypothetical protein [Bacilli bacterium]
MGVMEEKKIVRTRYYINRTKSFDCRYDNLYGNVLVTLKKDKTDLDKLRVVLEDNPQDNIIISEIDSVDTFNLLVSIFTNLSFDGTVTLDLLSNADWQNGLVKNTIIDLFNIPSYIKIKGFQRDNEQDAFAVWTHNQKDSIKERLFSHLTDLDKKLFEGQEQVINDFYNQFMEVYKYDDKSIVEEDPRVLMVQIFRLIQSRYALDRSLSFDLFTGNFIKTDNPKAANANNPVHIYKEGKGTSDGRVQLLTLLANNSKFKLDCTPVWGNLISGHLHEWNEYIDSNNRIYHFDLAFGMEGLPEAELMGCKERTIEGEYPSVENIRSTVVYAYRPGIGKKEDKK